jgi:hypothetical protein
MTSTRRLGPGWAMRALGWATGRLRDLHDELTWAYAATFRPVSPPRADRPDSAARPPVPVKAGSGDDTRQPEPAKAGTRGADGPA